VGLSRVIGPAGAGPHSPPLGYPAGQEGGVHQRWRDPARLLVVLCWAVVVVPRLFQTLTAVKRRSSVSSAVPKTSLSLQSERLLELVLIAFCVLLVARRARRLPTDHGSTLFLMSAPWVFMALRDIAVGERPKISSALYLFVVVAVWVLRPRLEHLRLLAGLVAWTAVLSLVLGLAWPSRGLFTGITGDQITPTKQLLPWGLLIGPFTDPNNLGQFLVLGLPAAALVPNRLKRTLIVVVTVTALVWTSSRSSLGAAVVGAVAALILAPLHPVTQRTIGRGLLALLGGVLVLLPLLTTSDTAFTNRGYIWKHGLSTWREAVWLGHGSAWYSEIGQFANALGQLAFHGHNQFVHTLVTGGLVYLALTAGLVIALAVAASAWARRGTIYPVIYLCTFLVSCTLEVSFGVVDRSFLLAVTVLPMALILFAEPTPDLPVLRIYHRVHTAQGHDAHPDHRSLIERP
jgi:O-antigen ligase